MCGCLFVFVYCMYVCMCVCGPILWLDEVLNRLFCVFSVKLLVFVCLVSCCVCLFVLLVICYPNYIDARWGVCVCERVRSV